MPKPFIIQKLRQIIEDHPELSDTINEAIEIIDDSRKGRALAYDAHVRLIKENPVYAHQVDNLRISIGREISVSLKVIDDLATFELFRSLYEKKPFLIAGCQVTMISPYDMVAAFAGLRNKVEAIAHCSITDFLPKPPPAPETPDDPNG